MEIKEFINLIGKKKQTLFIFIAFFILISAIFTFIQPFEYEAQSKILIIDEKSANSDPFSLAVKKEQIGMQLKNILESKDFTGEILPLGYKINNDFFKNINGNKWKKIINVNLEHDVGILNIKIYNTDKVQADQISRAINSVLKTNIKKYTGDEKLNIKIITQPEISRYPVKPNIFLNLSIGLILGFIAGLLYIYGFPEEKYNLRIFPKKRNLFQHLKH